MMWIAWMPVRGALIYDGGDCDVGHAFFAHHTDTTQADTAIFG
jgi:hypothetical protein